MGLHMNSIFLVLLTAGVCSYKISGQIVQQNLTTESSTVPLTTTAFVSNICQTEKHYCSATKFCVPDPTFFKGFRCCKGPVCQDNTNEGRYCPDPGMVANARRIPDIRLRKYPFGPGETIIFTCCTRYKFVNSGRINCTKNGTWAPGLPVCIMHNHTVIIPVPSSTTLGSKQLTPGNNKVDNTLPGLMGGLIALLLVCISAWCIWRKWKGTNEALLGNQSVVLENSYKPVSVQPVNLMSEAIDAEDFSQYVALHHHNNDQRFNEEFEEIQNCTQSRPSCEASSQSENKDKNRYTNIVAYDHTRVRLHQNKTKHNIHRGSDYINANYVSSYEKPKAYIACQGPMPSTFNDFWKMIWENNIVVIVMITNLMEKGRRKCDQYWPQEGKEQYKHVTVTLKQTKTYANYIIRSFSVKNTKLGRRNGNERKVVQFHFSQWPDHGTPEYLLPVLTFIRRSSLANGNSSAPIVVHCSAGVGRTGTYIVIHSMMQMLRKTGKVSIIGFLHHIRMQRNHLVQTEDQYVFVHDALLEYITSGITECSSHDLSLYFTKLISTTKAGEKRLEPNPAKDKGEVGSATFRSPLEKQFMKIVYSRLDTLDYDFATRAVNERKNRPGSVLPVFRSRVLLRTRTSAEGSDYINASFVQGYRSSHEFVVTQLPLSNTRKDFWQLIWDHNVPTIVTLKDKEWNDSTDVYWPSASHATHCPAFNVSYASEKPLEVSSDGGCTLLQRDFILEATKDDYVLEVRQFELSAWPNEHPTKSQFEALKLIYKHTALKEGTTVLQDRNGSTSAIQFACWHLLHSQLVSEDTVDVYQSAMLACQMRPRVFTSPAHLKFLYEAVLLEVQSAKDPLPSSETSTTNSTIKIVSSGGTELLRTAPSSKRQSICSSDPGSHSEQRRLLIEEEEEEEEGDSSSPQQSDKTEMSVLDEPCQEMSESPEA